MTKHAGADGACPDHGSSLDPCPPECASGTCKYAAPKGQRVSDHRNPGDMHEPPPYRRGGLQFDDPTE